MPLAPCGASDASCGAPPSGTAVFVLQVTDATERAMQLRVLSARGLRVLRPALQDARGMIDFMQREFPSSLPTVRTLANGVPVT